MFFFLGSCMNKLGITIVRTVDTRGRLTFHGFNPIRFLRSNSAEHQYLNYRDLYWNNKKVLVHLIRI